MSVQTILTILGIWLGVLISGFVFFLLKSNAGNRKTRGKKTSGVTENTTEPSSKWWMPNLEQRYWRWSLFWGTAGVLLFFGLWAWDEAGYGLTHKKETYVAYGNGSSMSIDQCRREEKLSPPAGGFPMYIDVVPSTGLTLKDLGIYIQTYKRVESGDLVRYGNAFLYEGTPITECTAEVFSLILKPKKGVKKRVRIDQGVVYFRIDTTHRCAPHTGELYTWSRNN